MNLKKLFDMQKGLDRHIEAQHQLDSDNLFNRKVLALLVELGELANETRCFKFWSLKGPSADDVILEEFVDGLHFILSLGIECEFEDKAELTFRTEQSEDLTEQFLSLYQWIGEFRETRMFHDYQTILNEYLHLAGLMGFSMNQIEQAYIQKNEVNYERQQQGY